MLLNLLRSGLLSYDKKTPYSVCALGLESLSKEEFASAMQHKEENVLLAFEKRYQLLKNLAHIMKKMSLFTGKNNAELGELYRLFHQKQKQSNRIILYLQRIFLKTYLIVSPRYIFENWEGPLIVEGHSLGDTWHHPCIKAKYSCDGYVPFHKLAQWLCYSLFEPLQELSSIKIEDINKLTGLPEYRNGGLLVDFSYLELKDKNLYDLRHNIQDILVVEWRALTLIALDKIYYKILSRLGVQECRFPLTKVLQGELGVQGVK